MKTRKKYLLAKIESTYGVDPTPTNAEAILTMGLQRTPYDGNTIERDTDRSTLGADESINTAPFVTYSFGVECAGSSALGVAPGFGALLRACGMAETINASTSVEYDPVSASYESVAQYYDRDVERQISLGMRGNLNFDFNRGQIPKMNFVFTGLYNKPVTLTPVVPNTSVFQTPLPVTNANTPTCTLGAYDLILQSLNIDLGNQVTHQNLVNLEDVKITDRQSTGTMTLLAPEVTSKDLFALVESHSGTITKEAFQLIHGPAGNLFQIDCPAMQLTTITEVDIEGEAGYQIGFKLIPVSGDDEIKITIK